MHWSSCDVSHDFCCYTLVLFFTFTWSATVCSDLCAYLRWLGNEGNNRVFGYNACSLVSLFCYVPTKLLLSILVRMLLLSLIYVVVIDTPLALVKFVLSVVTFCRTEIFGGKCMLSSVCSAACIYGNVGQQHNSTGYNRKQLRNTGRGFASKLSNKRYTVIATSGLMTILCVTKLFCFW